MSEIAKRIVIDHERMTLFVDGREFPWAIGLDGPIPNAIPGDGPTVTVTLLADNVEVIGTPTLDAPAGRDSQGDIRTFEGRGALIARHFDTRDDIQGWRDMARTPRFIALYNAALAVLDAEEVANA
ncbi:hypothetical protein [Nocardia sp. NPDC046763]|uniref:hypothetical protein n=1 Tax=Nocardia sp. NPDC046763 TaxID=3155256 RepID=UPI0033E22E81